MTAPFRMPITIPWSDTDPAGIVWFGNFFRYLEQAEEELFRAHGRDRNEIIDTFDIWMPRVEVTTKFRAPAKLGDRIAIRLGVQALTERRVTYGFEFVSFNADRLLAEGTCRVACVDRSTFKGREFPDDVRALLARVAHLAVRT